MCPKNKNLAYNWIITLWWKNSNVKVSLTFLDLLAKSTLVPLFFFPQDFRVVFGSWGQVLGRLLFSKLWDADMFMFISFHGNWHAKGDWLLVSQTTPKVLKQDCVQHISKLIPFGVSAPDQIRQKQTEESNHSCGRRFCKKVICA